MDAKRAQHTAWVAFFGPSYDALAKNDPDWNNVRFEGRKEEWGNKEKNLIHYCSSIFGFPVSRDDLPSQLCPEFTSYLQKAFKNIHPYLCIKILKPLMTEFQIRYLTSIRSHQNELSMRDERENLFARGKWNYSIIFAVNYEDWNVGRYERLRSIEVEFTDLGYRLTKEWKIKVWNSRRAPVELWLK